jgi:hypothetical protein
MHHPILPGSFWRYNPFHATGSVDIGAIAEKEVIQ